MNSTDNSLTMTENALFHDHAFSSSSSSSHVALAAAHFFGGVPAVEEEDDLHDEAGNCLIHPDDYAQWMAIPAHDPSEHRCECYTCAIKLLDRAESAESEYYSDLMDQNARVEELEAELEALRAAAPAAAAPAPKAAPKPKATGGAGAPAPAAAAKPKRTPVKKETDLSEMCSEGETVRVYFGAKADKAHYDGTYSGGKISYTFNEQDTSCSPSTFAKLAAVTHFGMSHEKQAYNGWIKCMVERDGAWVTLDSLRG